MIQIENDPGSFTSSDEDSDMTEETTDKDFEVADVAMTSEAVVKEEEEDEEAKTMGKIADAIRGVYINHDMPPLDQQDLPPMHTVAEDGSMVINRKVLKGDEIPRGIIPSEEYGTITSDNAESGYYSKVMSAVQDRLSHSSQEALPFEGVAMTAQFKKGPTMGLPTTASAASRAFPESLFRTGESFEIEIRLATMDLPGSTLPPIPFPKEYVGIRFPHEMVKRINGQPVSILNEKTYDLRMSIELGKPSGTTMTTTVQPDDNQESSHNHPGDGILLPGVCHVCSRTLQQSKKPSAVSTAAAVDTTVSPILHFYVPALPAFALPSDADTTMSTDLGSNVVELRNGQLEVKAKVSCSSLHHLLQRDRTRIAMKLQLQPQTPLPSSSSSSTSTPFATGPTSLSSPSSTSFASSLSEKSKAELKDLDTGLVFTFELVHPITHTVVAKAVTGPIFFQSYSLKR